MKKSILAILLIWGAVTLDVSAQQLKIESLTETNDIIPGDDQRRDHNQQLCALVKVQVVDDVTNVEGNVMGDILDKGVEKWVYMAGGSKSMVIHTKRHLKLRVTFQNCNRSIRALKRNRVYELVLSSPLPAAVDTVAVPQGHFRLEGLPIDAAVTISSKNMLPKPYQVQADGRLEVGLPYGRYNYKVRVQGYHDYESSYFVTDDGHWETVPLSPIMGTLKVECPTAGAEFYVDGELVASTSFSLEKTPDRYFVEVRKKKQHKGLKVTVFPDKTTIVTIPDLNRPEGAKDEVVAGMAK